MTIIVAVKTDTKIIIGSDKRVTEDKTIVSENESKILIKELTVADYNNITHEKFLIAFSGAYSLFELLKTFCRKDSILLTTSFRNIFRIVGFSEFLRIALNEISGSFAKAGNCG